MDLVQINNATMATDVKFDAILLTVLKPEFIH
jgi:hypothetical protein